ncbi:dihydrofolate reductase [Arcobacteraceae bacterium]|nr:dihydrofolate reductase [Arcobacteraceae bacterium]
MKISMIVAYGKNWEIGLDNEMLWHISEDFKNFKEITSKHHILMGRKTFESIGKPLPNRTSIVLSNSDFKHEGVHTFNDIQKSLDFARESGEEEIFIIGGASIYETLFPYVDKMYLTQVDFDGEADAFLQPIDFSTWDLTHEKSYDAILEEGKVRSPAWNFKVWIKRD